MSHEDERRPLLSHTTVVPHALDNACRFDIRIDELMTLVDPKNISALVRLGGVDKICQSLHVNPKMGLNDIDDDLKARRDTFGSNVLPEAKSKSLWQLIVGASDDKTLIMLTVAAVISLVIGVWQDYSPQHPHNEPRVGWVEGTAILVAVITVILTNAINDYQKEMQFKKLNAKGEDKKVTVLRDSREQRICASTLVVGDVLMLEPGDVVSVDCLYLDGYNLACDESAATGESEAVRKRLASEIENEQDDCFILSGSKVLEGVGHALVIAVGRNAFYGKTMMALRTNSSSGNGPQQQSTPLQLKLDVLAEQIAKFGFGASITMLVTLIIKYFATTDNLTGPKIMSTLINIIIQTITIIVVAVPEGLPMAVTMSLAFATTQMLKDNNLVRVLSACEIMGNATTICTDKTGTLTENQMTVVKGTLGVEAFDNNNVESWMKQVDPAVIDLVIQSISVNSTAYKDGDTFLGSTTECALLIFSQQLGGDFSAVRHQAHVVKVYPFSSKRKSMTTVLALSDENKKQGSDTIYRVHIKGASEIILQSCSRYVNAHGDAELLDDNVRQHCERVIDKYAGDALRTIALAYRDMSADDYTQINQQEEPALENLVLIGIVGIMDPLRPGVVESVTAFRRAGVFVRMITGDNIKTATAIAKSAGIYTSGGVVLNADKFRDMSPDEQRNVIPRLQVLARSTPTDKTMVVIRLQELDQVVGMTGDGVNDGPALKLADVGFSMGVTGTEVAKEASDIVLMDDNFNSILRALLWGRTVNDGVRKFLTFQLTVNVAAVVISFVSATTSSQAQSVLSAVQLLWVNLIMDTLAALALATEQPTMEQLNRKPASKYAHLINYRMVKMILGQSVFQIGINLAAIYAGPQIFGINDEAVLRTMVFNMFVFLQIFNEINCRRVDLSLNVFANITNDWIFLLVQLLVILGQFLIVTFGGIAFRTTPLTFKQWMITIGIGALSLPVGLIIRMVPDCFGFDRRFNEDARPLTSYSRLNWEGAIGHVRTQLRVYSALRRSYQIAQGPENQPHYAHHYKVPHHHTSKHPNENFSAPGSHSSYASSHSSSVASAPIHNVSYESVKHAR
ncbi:PMCA-type calcium-translocating P-type ATPase [Lichtheimia hyalospora FSU 10163]|nr:PMCA-type calcium-translocating P-type ATPase [Lichtheimia hyalospora FSU 10163]